VPPAPLLFPVPGVGLFDSIVAGRLWSAAKEMVRAFWEPRLPFETPPGVVVPLLVFGVFLVVAGTVFAAAGKGGFARAAALAAGAAGAGWILWGGAGEVATFFQVLLLVLKFLGGITLVVGLTRSFWVPALLLAAVMLAATGTVDAGLLGTVLGLLASFLGALSLFRRGEELSPGRKGSRWNRRTALGWVACLLAAGMLDTGGPGAYGKHFRIAGMVVGAGVLVLGLRRPRGGIPRPS